MDPFSKSVAYDTNRKKAEYSKVAVTPEPDILDLDPVPSTNEAIWHTYLFPVFLSFKFDIYVHLTRAELFRR